MAVAPRFPDTCPDKNSIDAAADPDQTDLA
jgi:hypothetical protein